MKKKTYSVKVKMIKETEFYVEAKSMNLALIEVGEKLKNKKESELTETFNKQGNFKYKVDLIKLEKKSSVQN